MEGGLNVMSLILGLIAWILPVVNLMRYKKRNHRSWVILSFLSMSACATSLYLQIVYNDHLVQIADWTALMDTSEFVVYASKVLLVVTLLLNAITLFVYRERTVKSSL